MTTPAEQIEYEHMLSSRFAAQNVRLRSRKPKLERSQLILLSRLEASGPMSVGALAEAFGLDVSTVHRQVAAAMRVGLVERTSDAAGGTARTHSPTEKGAALLAEERAIRAEAFGSLLADWSEDDRRTFGDLLRRFNEASEARQGLPWPRS